MTFMFSINFCTVSNENTKVRVLLFVLSVFEEDNFV